MMTQSASAARALAIHATDNVAVMTVSGANGAVCSVRSDGHDTPLSLISDVPFGHKVAIAAIPRGTAILKYGLAVGIATQDIAPGEHVHVHNVASVKPALAVNTGKSK